MFVPRGSTFLSSSEFSCHVTELHLGTKRFRRTSCTFTFQFRNIFVTMSVSKDQQRSILWNCSERPAASRSPNATDASQNLDTRQGRQIAQQHAGLNTEVSIPQHSRCRGLAFTCSTEELKLYNSFMWRCRKIDKDCMFRFNSVHFA